MPEDTDHYLVSTRTILFVCVALVAASLAWVFLGMRAVLGVGGACADGGPYASTQSCPDGSWLLFPAVAVLVGAAVWGSSAAGAVGAPSLQLPVWAATFLLLGWNFWEFGLSSDPGGRVAGWVVCGALFWALAAPAVWLLFRQRGVAAGSWWLRYAALSVVAVAVGVLGFGALV